MYAVFDLETTGFGPRDRVLEIAVAHVDGDGRLTDRWSTLVNPHRDLGPQSVHGILSADARRAPEFAQIAGEVRSRLAGRVPVAHNLAFDARFLDQEYRRLGHVIPDLAAHGVCTMSWAAHFLPGERRTLAACCLAAGIDNERPHEAMSDVLATVELLTFYLGSTSVIPPWDGLRALAAAQRWPALPTTDVRPVNRGAAAEAAGLLTRLAERPHRREAADTTGYRSMLDRALVDRYISAAEADALVAMAARLGIGRATAARLHRDHLAVLASALIGGPLDARSELQRVAAQLSMDDVAVETALRSAAAGAAPEVPDRFWLARDDIVVLTGTFAESKAYWADRLTAAGLAVAANVTKRTALVLAADPDSMSGKATRARAYGIPVVGVAAVDPLLSRLAQRV